MRVAYLAFLSLFVLFVASASPSIAHHGWSSYDGANLVKVEAPVEAVRYQQPHGEIEVMYEGKRWVIVLAPPSRMKSRGLSEDDLKVGTTVVVEAYPKRNGEAEMRAERVSVNGKTIELR